MRRLLIESLELRALPSVSPLGDVFPVNQFTAGSQRTWPESPQAVAADAEGNFIATWTSAGQAGAEAVYMRRFWASGEPRESEIRVNEPLGKARYSSVAVGAGGEAVIVWTAYEHLDGSGQGVFGRYFDPGGQPSGGVFQVNQTEAYHQRTPAVAFTADGEFVVTWADLLGDDDFNGIKARRFFGDGVPLSDEFLVNSTTVGNQFDPVVSSSVLGESFYVAWTDDRAGRSEIRAQHFSAEGAQMGDEFLVSETADAMNRWPRIATAADGSLLATWSVESAAGGGWDVVVRRFSVQGVPLSAPAQVNTTTTGDQRFSALTVDSDGNALIAWMDNSVGATSPQVVLREVANTGVPFGAEIHSPLWSAADQTAPALGLGPLGQATLIWTAEGRDGSSKGVFGQSVAYLAMQVTGDTNFDGQVDLADLNNVRNHFGETGNVLGDANRDGAVDLADLNAVRNNLGVANSNRQGIADRPALADRAFQAMEIEFAGTVGVNASTVLDQRTASLSAVDQVFNSMICEELATTKRNRRSR
ncbi:MAG: hypothetical protein SGJ19_08015 [Planctomycetia bacterium]|nr:hypothetical protein [Planctomycetia bacterium]